MYTPKYLKKWERVRDYGGEDLSEWYILIAQTRDSYLLERVNFKDVQNHIKANGIEIAGNLEDCRADNAVLLASFGHWACGWIESLMIHESNDTALMLADEIKAKLDDYPIFDEDSYTSAESDMQWNHVREYIVKDYLWDNDIEYDDKFLDTMTSHILRNCDVETTNYDEVILSKDIDLAPIVDRIQHITTCVNCKDEIDNRSESCSCQLPLMN